MVNKNNNPQPTNEREKTERQNQEKLSFCIEWLTKYDNENDNTL